MAWLRQWGVLGALLVGALVLQGCGGGSVTGRPIQSGPPAEMQDADLALRAYELGPGDGIRVTVYRHPDLSGEFELDGQGRFSMPLVGEIDARDLTVRALEQRIAQTLRQGYLVDPQVSVDVLLYRPFTIIGEVGSAGRYPYEAGMTVIDAVARAGGFTARARTGSIIVSRGTINGIAFYARPDTPILPGDLIEVPERFF